MPKRIPILAASDISKAHDCRQVIVVAWDGERTHVVTYGVSPEECDQAAQGGNFVKRALGWPESLCNEEPTRVKRLKARVAELEALVESVSQGAAFAQGKLANRIAELQANNQALEDNAMQYRRMVGDLEGRIGNALL